MQNTTVDGFLETLAEALATKLGKRLKPDCEELKPRLLTVAQAARYLGRTEDAIQHLIAEKRLPVVREGRRVFLDVQQLDRWIETNTEPAGD